MLDRFEIVNYSGVYVRNLTERVIAVKNMLKKYDTYFPYFIKEGERPDTIAADYYGRSDYDWLILLTNEIYDVNYDWPLTYHQFISYMKAKYGDDYITTKNTIKHYRWAGIDGNVDEGVQTHTISQTTYDNLSIQQQSEWRPVYIYDWEVDANEEKRKINLLSNRFINQIDREMRDLFDNVE